MGTSMVSPSLIQKAINNTTSKDYNNTSKVGNTFFINGKKVTEQQYLAYREAEKKAYENAAAAKLKKEQEKKAAAEQAARESSYQTSLQTIQQQNAAALASLQASNAKTLEALQIKYTADIKAMQEASNQQITSLQQSLAEALKPKNISSTQIVSGVPVNQKQIQTLGTSEIQQRRDVVDTSYLGTKQLRIKKASDGVPTNTSSLNTTNTQGLNI